MIETFHHDYLPGYMANEHIDWTDTTEDLSTTGLGTFGTLTLADGSIIDSGGTIDIGAFGAGNNVDVNILFGDTTLSDLYAGTLRILDGVGETYYLQFLSAGTELTADRVLSIDVGNAAKTITLSGNPTLGDWFDQSVKTTATPTFPQVIFDGVDVAYIDVAGNNLEVLNNVTGGNLILGTVSGYVSVSEDLVVNGTVGIGTASPTFGKLEIYGNGADTRLTIHEDGGGHKAELHLRSGSGDTRLYGLGNTFSIDTESLAQAFTILTDGKVGIGTNAPDSIFHIKANVAGTVGSHPAGQLIIQDPDDTVFGNAVITGYESDGAGNPDQQLWYLGSSSSSNSAIIFLNRRNSKLQLGTNGVSRLTILGNGNVGIGEISPQDKLEVNGTVLVKDTLKIKQDDGDEFIDSLADGYMDYGATTAHRFNTPVRGATSLWWRIHHIDLASTPALGAVGAIYTPQSANNLNGYQLDNAPSEEYLYFNVHIGTDWDEASDLELVIQFETNVDNSGGGGDAGDTVDFDLLMYYKGVGETTQKTQDLDASVVVGEAAQYTHGQVTFTIDYDKADHVVQIGDCVSFRLHLNTTDSEVDNVIAHHAMFRYKTNKVRAEI